MNIRQGKWMRKVLPAGIGLALVLLCGAPLWSQEDGDVSAFAGELAEILAREGWTIRETDALRESLQAMVRTRAGYLGEEIAGADPEMAALALRLARRAGEEANGAGQAMLALEVARMAREMETLGYERPVITRAALNGVRDLLAERRALRDEGRDGELGDLIRARLREQLQTARRDQERLAAHTRLRERAGGMAGGFGGPGGGGAGGPPWR